MKSKELKKNSKDTLSGNWGIVIGALFIIVVLSSVVNGPAKYFGGSYFGYLLSIIATFCIISVMHTGQTWLNLDIYDKKEASISTVFSGFTKIDYVRVVMTNILVTLFTMFWSLLFIIPGLIKFFSYSQTMYILKDYPELSPNKAITKSRELMNGHKFELFKLLLSFINWLIFPMLCILGGIFIVMTMASSPITYVGVVFIEILVLGIYLLCVSIYLVPYFNITMAGFYREVVLKDHKKEELQ